MIRTLSRYALSWLARQSFVDPLYRAIERERERQEMFCGPSWAIDINTVNIKDGARILLNIESHVSREQSSSTTSDYVRNIYYLSTTMNILLLQRHPDLYNLNSTMRGPMDNATEYGDAVVAKSRRLNVEMPSDNDRFRRPKSRLEANVIRDEIAVYVDQIAQEIRLEKADLAKQGKLICPYVPIYPSGMFTDPTTFEASMRFSTRYGITG